VAGCVERASLYQLSRSEASEIVDHQIDTIVRDWHGVCDEAELTDGQRRVLWNRQFLNPGTLEGWTAPVPSPPPR